MELNNKKVRELSRMCRCCNLLPHLHMRDKGDK
jgi:hypothetical protein